MGSGMDATQPARDRRRRVGMAAGLAFLLAGSAAYFAWPRPADLAAFDPDAMARLETQMWRDYYGKQYAALSRHLYAVSRASSTAFRPWTASGSRSRLRLPPIDSSRRPRGPKRKPLCRL